MATGDQYITQSMGLNHPNCSSPHRAIKRQQNSLESVECSGNLSVLDLLNTSGSWCKNYPGVKNSRAIRSSALKSSGCEIIRPTVRQLLTSIQELLVLFSSITWRANEIQKARGGTVTCRGPWPSLWLTVA